MKAINGDMLSMADAVEYRKKPTATVRAIEVDHPFVVRTLEGTMRGEPGDFLVKGTHGERYPVKRDIFLDTYEEVGE